MDLKTKKMKGKIVLNKFQNELTLATSAKNNKKRFFQYERNIKKVKEMMDKLMGADGKKESGSRKKENCLTPSYICDKGRNSPTY